MFISLIWFSLIILQGAAHFILEQQAQIHMPRQDSLLFSCTIQFSIHKCSANHHFFRSCSLVPCCCASFTKLHASYESTVLSFSTEDQLLLGLEGIYQRHDCWFTTKGCWIPPGTVFWPSAINSVLQNWQTLTAFCNKLWQKRSPDLKGLKYFK